MIKVKLKLKPKPKPEINYEDIIKDKELSPDEFQKEIQKIINFKQGTINKTAFVGNKILYHFQMDVLCRTHRKNKKSLHEICHNPKELEVLKEQTVSRNRTGTMANRLFEAWRINNGSITFFKMCNATYIYKKYNATKVLDMTAGWGGRILGAINLNIEYTGFDTNLLLKPGYEALNKCFPNHRTKMIWRNCLDYDFSTLDYDFMLTSPPYEDIEVYEHMTTYTKDEFYKSFLICMIDKCRKWNKGYTAINISPQMYKLLTDKYKYEQCLFTEDLKEQKNGKTPDMIYFWK
jgi:hypothetical protein